MEQQEAAMWIPPVTPVTEYDPDEITWMPGQSAFDHWNAEEAREEEENAENIVDRQAELLEVRVAMWMEKMGYSYVPEKISRMFPPIETVNDENPIDPDIEDKLALQRFTEHKMSHPFEDEDEESFW